MHPSESTARAPDPGEERFHGLDMLRGGLMLLGVVLHGALFFMKGGGALARPFGPEGGGHGVFNLLAGWIHLFRMPAFFVLAGFFGALLWERRGAAGFLRHRVRRVLLPLAVAWALIGPLVAVQLAGLGAYRTGGWTAAAETAWKHLAGGAWLARPNLMHLWFLWYLFLLCVGMWAVLRSFGLLPGRWRERASALLARAGAPHTAIPTLMALTTLTLRPMRTAAIATGTSLWPNWPVLATYAVFFGAGWLWYRRRDRCAWLQRGWGWRLGIGALLGVVGTAANFGTMAARTRPTLALLAVTAASCWWIILGLIGLFERHFAKPHPVGRTLADASYWVYLVHIPVLIAFAPALGVWSAPLAVKFAALVATALALCLGSYLLFVRRTWIGVLLNGARRVRG